MLRAPPELLEQVIGQVYVINMNRSLGGKSNAFEGPLSVQVMTSVILGTWVFNALKQEILESFLSQPEFHRELSLTESDLSDYFLHSPRHGA